LLPPAQAAASVGAATGNCIVPPDTRHRISASIFSCVSHLPQQLLFFSTVNKPKTRIPPIFDPDSRSIAQRSSRQLLICRFVPRVQKPKAAISPSHTPTGAMLSHLRFCSCLASAPLEALESPANSQTFIARAVQSPAIELSQNVNHRRRCQS
jgi:hypothetical protein